MLGNWSFGDYFKENAIQYSWDLLTNVYGLDPSRIYVTYFGGNEAGGLDPDLESRDIWISRGLPADHVVPGTMKDNFWEMGDQGPCGPCSEIHYDRIGGRNAAHLVNQDDPHVLEIWNNVFIQYNREPDRSLRPLPNKHVDTGMGYERLVSILQEEMSNYDTDVFYPLFKAIQDITGAREYQGRFGPDDLDGIDTAYRVIADHVRTLAFAIADGAVPNSDGRGYVIRRVLRRGARYARKYFNVGIGNFFSKIVPTLVDQLGGVFPELRRKQGEVMEILDEEEISFSKTLDRGERQFENYAQQAKIKGEDKLHGADVWRLYDTFGFPVDLTKIIAEERGLRIDDQEFEEARLKAREASKGAKKAAEDTIKLDVHSLGMLGDMNDVPKTDDTAKFKRGNITSQIKTIYDGRRFIDSTSEICQGNQLGIILDRTNFYAEQGGQVNDTGKIIIDGKAELEVGDVQSYAGYVLHTGVMKYGTFSVGESVICEYDELRRWPVRNNHTGTHVLNFALRDVLGDGVEQKGSLVAPEKLRFDFSCKSAVSETELQKIEEQSRDYIRQNCPVYSKDVPLAIAREIAGVRAVFGEVYPDPVRVVSVGVELEEILKNVKDPRWRGISIEFCGGTHVQKTNDIKDLVILEESGIAKGIRRITAVTGEDAREVQRVASEFAKRLDNLSSMQPSLQKDILAKHIQVELHQLSISAVQKAKFRDLFSRINKEIIEGQKAQQKQETRKALESITSYFQSEEYQDRSWLVVELPTSANPKVISESLSYVKSKLPEKSVYLLAVDRDQRKVCHGCYVSEVGYRSFIRPPFNVNIS
jgi:alanyl-tRNA synthetase